jgi:transcriptional regulator with XRE-family HTH domain
VNAEPVLGCDFRGDFATIFKAWRRKKNLLLKQIAADLGVSARIVSLWEHGRRFPDGNNIGQILQYTGLTFCRLFCLKAPNCTRRLCQLKKSPRH